MIQFALYAAPGGPLLADYSGRVEQPRIAYNTHGAAEASGFVPMGLQEAFQLYDRAGLLHVVFADSASDTIYAGRLEDVAIRGDGVALRAFGYSRALSDVPYTALWSTTDVQAWDVLTSTDITGTNSDKYIADTNNRLYLGLQKGTIYTSALDFGIWGTRIPDGSSRTIVGVSFDMILSLPVGWTWFAQTRTATWGSPASIDTIAGSGGVATYNRFYTFTGAAALDIGIYNSAGVNYTATAENGTHYMIITNVRIVTSTANKVDTTSTAGVIAGAGISVPVVSSARMYVGQRLHMGIPAANGFAATVLTIPDGTHFTADLSAAMASGGNVQAHVIYADEIAKDIVSAVSALNPTQLSTATGLIESPALDLLDESYADQYGADILDRLTRLGDSQATPRQWEWGVTAARQLVLRPQGSAARTWYVDVSDIDIQRSIDTLYNSVYATYQEAGGRALRSAASTNAASVARSGLTRQKVLSVQTSSSTQAAIQRDAELHDTADPRPRAGLTIRHVTNANGSDWPLTQVRAGDTMIIRNLPPTLSSTIDRIRTFRIVRVALDLATNELTVEPESPLPTLAALLAQALPPAWITAPWWIQIQR